MSSKICVRYFSFLIIIALMVPARKMMADEINLLQTYSGAYNVTHSQDFPVAGSHAIMFQVKSNFPPQEIIDYYDKLFESSGFQDFTDFGATRKWRTYHKYYQDTKYRTTEYLASWWDINNSYLYSLLLRYSNPSKATNNSKELSVTIQKVPLSKENYTALHRQLEKISSDNLK